MGSEFSKELIDALTNQIVLELDEQYNKKVQEYQEFIEKKHGKEFELLEQTFKDRKKTVLAEYEDNLKLMEKHGCRPRITYHDNLSDAFSPTWLIDQVRNKYLLDMLKVNNIQGPKKEDIRRQVVIELATSNHPQTVIKTITTRQWEKQA